MIGEAWLFCLLMTVGSPPCLLAQSPVTSGTPGCKESHRTVTPRNPRLAADGRILPGQAFVQARLTLDRNTIVRIVEYPRYEGKPWDNYNPTIIIKRGQEEKRYPMATLMKDGGQLRPVEIASLCNSPDEGMLFLGFEVPFTGMAEGFVVIQYSPVSIRVQALPWASQGRIVVNKSAPTEVELWSATGSASLIDCDLCRKYYSVQDCHVGQDSVQCKAHPGPRRTGYPGKFINARIEIR